MSNCNQLGKTVTPIFKNEVEIWQESITKYFKKYYKANFVSVFPFPVRMSLGKKFKWNKFKLFAARTFQHEV